VVKKKTKKTQATATKPKLLASSNPQIPLGYGDAPVRAYINAMPGWKDDPLQAVFLFPMQLQTLTI
jgi:hypothetical protein